MQRHQHIRAMLQTCNSKRPTCSTSLGTISLDCIAVQQDREMLTTLAGSYSTESEQSNVLKCIQSIVALFDCRCRGKAILIECTKMLWRYYKRGCTVCARWLSTAFNGSHFRDSRLQAYNRCSHSPCRPPRRASR